MDCYVDKQNRMIQQISNLEYIIKEYNVSRPDVKCLILYDQEYLRKLTIRGGGGL